MKTSMLCFKLPCARFLIALCGLLSCTSLISTTAWAQTSPAGTWITIDDESGKQRAEVEIVEQGGELTGTITKIYNPERQDAVCELCEGANKDQPVLGMTIVYGLQQEPRDPLKWSGGSVLDAESGKVYKATATLIENGEKLELRGYVGIPLFGRSQVWLRKTEQ